MNLLEAVSKLNQEGLKAVDFKNKGNEIRGSLFPVNDSDEFGFLIELAHMFFIFRNQTDIWECHLNHAQVGINLANTPNIYHITDTLIGLRNFIQFSKIEANVVKSLIRRITANSYSIKSISTTQIRFGSDDSDISECKIEVNNGQFTVTIQDSESTIFKVFAEAREYLINSLNLTQ